MVEKNDWKDENAVLKDDIVRKVAACATLMLDLNEPRRLLREQDEWCLWITQECDLEVSNINVNEYLPVLGSGEVPEVNCDVRRDIYGLDYDGISVEGRLTPRNRRRMEKLEERVSRTWIGGEDIQLLYDLRNQSQQYENNRWKEWQNLDRQFLTMVQDDVQKVLDGLRFTIGD